jgi:hypothetical protein
MFSAVGIAELCKKMASYTTGQEVFVIETFHYYDGSCVAMESSQFVLHYREREGERETIWRIDKMFKATGRVCDKRWKGRINSAFALTEVVCAAREAIAKYPRNSVRLLAQQIWVSASTTWEIWL